MRPDGEKPVTKMWITNNPKEFAGHCLSAHKNFWKVGGSASCQNQVTPRGLVWCGFPGGVSWRLPQRRSLSVPPSPALVQPVQLGWDNREWGGEEAIERKVKTRLRDLIFDLKRRSLLGGREHLPNTRNKKEPLFGNRESPGTTVGPCQLSLRIHIYFFKFLQEYSWLTTLC